MNKEHKQRAIIHTGLIRNTASDNEVQVAMAELIRTIKSQEGERIIKNNTLEMQLGFIEGAKLHTSRRGREFPRTDTHTHTQAHTDILKQIAMFDEQCEENESTDVGDAWTLLNWIEDKLKETK